MTNCTKKCKKSVSFAESIADIIEIPRALDCEKEDLFYSDEDIRRFKEERHIAIQMHRFHSLLVHLEKKDNATLLSKFRNAISFGRQARATTIKSISRAA